MYTVKSRLMLIAFIGIASSILVTVFAALELTSLDGSLKSSQVARDAIRAQMELDMMHDAVRGDVYHVMLVNRPDERAAIRADFDEHTGNLRAQLDALAEMTLEADVAASVAATRPVLEAYVDTGVQLFEVASQDAEAARRQLPGFQKAFEGLEERNAAINDGLARMNRKDMSSAVERAQKIMIAIGGAAALFALGLAFLLGKRVAMRVAAVARTVGFLGQGDLRERTGVSAGRSGRCEVTDMAAALDRALDQLADVIGSARSVSLAVSGAASELSNAAEGVSGGVQEQAASLEESAAAIEEMTATTRGSADHARQADELASNSRQAAEQGGSTVHQAVSAMSEINQSSRKIADIILAIDEIAFQTNLLALNAAVEAARAGEHGRGFAVVAGEVRVLAQRSATAAREIKSLIEDSVRKVQIGSDLVNRSGDTLTSIVTSVKQVSDIVSEMATAARETSSGLDQINLAVTQMDQATQSNAAQSEEMAAAAQSLRDQAEQLRRLVAAFKVSDGARIEVESRPAPTAAAARPVVATRRPALGGKRAAQAQAAL